jgi:alkanesulfonate monooxygenase SsuD/methylene tetrahydromethanopterin reductase-like flavin-dependent oxidoreductase (luciferase family)
MSTTTGASQPVHYGLSVANFADGSDPGFVIELARLAERHGWDGFFLWDHLNGWLPEPVPLADPWIMLAGIAAVTERIRLGPMVTPLARRRPWKVAREATTLDHLSRGRLILGVGLGVPPETEFAAFGEEPDARIRAAKLDEGLEILAGLWRGEPYSFAGEHYRLNDVTFQPTPLQHPRIPIWVAAYWPHKAPLRRAARWDGVFPADADGAVLSPEAVRDLIAYVQSYRTDDSPFDVVLSGATPGDDPLAAAQQIAPLIAAGMTWWLEVIGPWLGGPDALMQRIRQGPPRLRPEPPAL